MRNIKLLISSLPSIGKTTLLQTLEDALVIARDGKQYPFQQAHVNVKDFDSADELIELVTEKINAYEKRYDELPKTVVFDSISKILLDIEGYCLAKIANYPYGKVNTEIKKVVDFIERDLVPEFNVVIVSHALYDEETNGYKLVNAGGSYGKKGGVLSEVDEAIFLELRGKNRVVHFRNPKMVSRSTVAELPDNKPAEEFNLQDHINVLRDQQSSAAEWSL
jgi:hypothetical protein